MYLGNFGGASRAKSSCIGSDLFNIILYVEVFYPIHILLILLDIMVALQTLKGIQICTRRTSPSGLIALLEIGSKFLSSMESLAHHEIGFNPNIFEILAFL